MSSKSQDSEVQPDPTILKRQRGAAKGSITRLVKQLNQIEIDDKPELAEEKLKALDEAFKHFSEVHGNYLDTLKDADDRDAALGYLSSVEREVQDVRHSILTWLRDVECEDTEDPCSRQDLPADTEAEVSKIDDNATTPSVGTEGNTNQLIRQLLAEVKEIREQRDIEKQQRQQQQQQQQQQQNEPRINEPSTPASHQVSPDGPSPSWQDSASLSQLMELSRLQLQSHADSMRLPPTEIMKFDGEPLKYWPFMRLFSTIVDKETVPAEEKLTRLLQYTIGPAREAISHCLYNPDPSAGYTNAMTLLRRRFGSPYAISQAWINKVLKTKDIKDNKQLQAFADTLRSCRDTLSAMKCEGELDSGRVLLQIVEKLPNDLKKRWLTRNYEITESGRLPRLSDVVVLVETEAAKRADPIFGNILGHNTMPSSGTRKPSSNDRPLQKQAFAAKPIVEPPQPSPRVAGSLKCPKCDQGHFLNQCTSFRSLSVPERLQFVSQKRLCKNCFMRGHTNTECTRTWVCKVPGCAQRHNSWLHSAIVANNRNSNDHSQPMTSQTDPKKPPTTPPSDVQAHVTTRDPGCRKGKVMLPILPVIVTDPEGRFSMRTHALLDSGSNGTFCSQALATTLQLKQHQLNIKLSTMESKDMDIDTVSVDLRVEDVKGINSYLMMGVLARDRLNISLDSCIMQDDLLKWSHLHDIADDINLPDVHLAGEIHLLIGLDQPDILAPRETRRGCQGEPYATLSGLGWTLNGPTAEGSATVSANFARVDTDLNVAVERFWKLDDPSYMNDRPMSVVDEQVVKMWDEQAIVEDGHYTLPIPFKENPPCLPNDYATAKHRLDLLGKRLGKNPDLKQQYTENIHDALRKGYAEEVPKVDRDDGCVWYLPHHPVIHPRKPGKIRVVFDCSARFRGTSLNDNVLQGPDLTNKLLGVLLRFRQEPVAICADIEGMFCQVRVPPDQRDVLRFLWWMEDDPDKPPVHYRMRVHLFGGIWCPSAATFALQRVATDHVDSFSSEAIKTIHRDFYVDDWLKSLPTEEAAMSLSSELREILRLGGFKLTKWVSNSKEVMKTIPPDEWATSLHCLDIDHDSLPRERALGVLWDVERDVFTFDTNILLKPTSKRGLLSTTSSVYDPLGFACPFVLKAKLLFQELCRRKVGWDDEIPEDLAESWRKWLADLHYLPNLAFPRCLTTVPTSTQPNIQLHHFSDASELAYGAASYLRIGDECRLIMAKGRLAPLKATTIPRLELLAAVVATELDQAIKRHLDISVNETFFWTDSTIVLQYIKNDNRRFQTFVANRISRIHEQSDPSQWHYVNSANNPADDVSRGLTAPELATSERWATGPSFLHHPEDDWPVQPILSGDLPGDAEIKHTKRVCALERNDNGTGVASIDRLFQRYSCWHRLKRVVALILRLKALLRKRTTVHLLDPIPVADLQQAEVAILTHVQTTSFGPTTTKTRSIARLKPLLDNTTGLLHVGGRLTHAPISYEAKHPIILPNNHHVTSLIASHYHLRLGHAGMERVLADIRQRYWIVKGRAAVSRILRPCLTCRKLKAAPENQLMADLPESRVTPNEPPFTRVGVDYFGPFYVKRARSELKRYGCLFTCLTTRAVHLEVAHSLDTDSFLNALQRFIARRGSPKEICSDNGSNLVGGMQELRRAINDWNQQKISNQLLQNDIQWRFNPPGASHMGGVWERQIRTVRSVLCSMLQLQRLDDEGLATLFCSVEAIVNGRPITKLSNDPLDPLPLTPNHLLLLRSGPVLPPGVFTKEDTYRRRWRQVQFLADTFWTRWIKEYLPTLQQRQKWLQPKRNVQLGDLVLILHEKTPRNSWPLGLVTDTYPGADGLVRSARVKTQTGAYDRPVSKLCLLEANFV